MKLERLNPGARMSQVVCAGELAFLAGQVPNDLSGDITAQTQEVLAKIDGITEQLGGSKADLISVQIWLADMEDFSGMNAVWDAWVDPQNPPARATGGVALARAGMRVEMIVVARLPG